MKRLRVYLYLIIAIIAYFVIHEGLHALQAIAGGYFEGIKLHAPFGIEVLITQPHTIEGWQLALFSGLSSIITIALGYALVALMPHILNTHSRIFKGMMYYITLTFLLLDPIYLSVFSFWFGGDINGIAMGLNVPYWVVRLVALTVFGIGLVTVLKRVYPSYTKNFAG